MNTVAVLVHRRHEIAKRTLAALQRCDDAQRWRLVIVTSSPTAQVRWTAERVVKEWPGEASIVHLPQSRDRDDYVCASVGAFTAISHGFATSDTVLYLEEDVVVAPDALRFAHWAAQRYRADPDVFAAGLWGHGRPGDDPYGVVRWPHLVAWGLVLWEERWEELIPRWSFQHWDRALQEARGTRSLVYPLVGRAQNIGHVDGTTPEGMAAVAETFAGDIHLPPWHERDAA